MNVIRVVGATIAGLVLASSSVAAQQATIPDFESELEAPSANSANPAPLPGDPVVSLNLPPNPRDLLTGLYATRALIEVCEVALEPEIASAMDADEAQFITRLGLSPEAAQSSYTQILAATEARAPDCAEGSADRADVAEVVAIYAQTVAAP